MRLPNPSPVLDKNRARMDPEILSSTGARVWRTAPKAFPDSRSVLDQSQSAKKLNLSVLIPFPNLHSYKSPLIISMLSVLGPALNLSKNSCSLRCESNRAIGVRWCSIRSTWNCGMSREKLYSPPPSPPFLAKSHFSGEGGGGVYFEPHAVGILYPPPFIHPPPLEGYYQGWGCIKFGPKKWLARIDRAR